LRSGVLPRGFIVTVFDVLWKNIRNTFSFQRIWIRNRNRQIAIFDSTLRMISFSFCSR